MTLTLPWGILAFILAVQSVANIGPMGLPAIAPLIRDDLHLSLTQAGSFLSAYEVVRVPVVSAAGYLAQAQATGILGRVGFGLLSDRLFGGRRPAWRSP